jgi:hypothetical protein
MPYCKEIENFIMYFSTVTLITYETIMPISLKFGMEVMPLKLSERYNLKHIS